MKPLLFPEFLNLLHPDLSEHAARFYIKLPLRLTWETKELLPVHEVPYGDLDLCEVVQNVKLRQVERIIAIY